jgi:hypothetical protein
MFLKCMMGDANEEEVLLVKIQQGKGKDKINQGETINHRRFALCFGDLTINEINVGRTLF